jgi:hypothetical protein
VAKLTEGLGDAAIRALGVEPSLALRARAIDAGVAALPCEKNTPDFAAVSELMAQLLVGRLGPLSANLLQVLVRRAMSLRETSVVEADFRALRRVATLPALERVRSLSAVGGLPRSLRREALREARDKLRPLAARAFLESGTELGRPLADRLPDELLLALASLPSRHRDSIGGQLRAVASAGLSTQRLRRKLRRLVSAGQRVEAMGCSAEGGTEQAEVTDHRQKYASEQRGLGLLLSLLDEAQELADGLGLSIRIALLPRALPAPPMPSNPSPQPSCHRHELCGLACSARGLLGWLDRLQRGLERIGAQLPNRRHALLWSQPVHPG